MGLGLLVLFLTQDMKHITFWVRGLEVDVGWDGLILERQSHLDDARQSRCAFTMADIRFDLIQCKQMNSRLLLFLTY
jgi:hypothetical protein